MGISASIARMHGIAGQVFRKQDSSPPAGAAKRDAKAFILQPFEDRKKWLLYIVSGIALVGITAFLISTALLNHPVAAVLTPADGIADSAATAGAARRTMAQPEGNVRKLARSLAGSAEAEAAVESASAVKPKRSVGSSSVTAAASKTFRPSASPTEMMLSSPSLAAITKGGDGAGIPVDQQVRELLLSVEKACESEDKDTLVSMLDTTNTRFRDRYVANAERLFRRFNNIAVSFTGIRVTPLNEEEALVNVHVRVEGTLELTGGWMVLSNRDQCFTLRRNAGSDWKLCAVSDRGV